MRLKLIALFSVIVLVVGGLTYALSRVAVRSIAEIDPKRAPQALDAAVAQLELDGLATERWVAVKATDEALREPFSAGTELARKKAAAAAAEKVYDAATTAPALSSLRRSISTVMLVDATGIVLGQNGSTQGGGNLVKEYPALKASLDSGAPGSDVWASQARDEQRLASYAPIRGADGKIVGALVVASELDDGRLTAVSERTSGNALVVAVKGDKGLRTVARSAAANEALVTAAGASPASDAVLKALESGETLDVSGLPSGHIGIARTLSGYGDGKRAAVIAIVKPPAKNVAFSLLWPAIAGVVLGIVLVVIAGIMLDAYLRRPIAEIEDGLLAIMNGQTNRRLDIEHAELGGVVFRINSLLNQLFGVTEDDTDEEGRPSRAPNGSGFTDALSVDESIAMAGGSVDSAALFAESDDAYYARVFGEYVQAKQSIGDPTDHITQGEFAARLRTNEQEVAQKHGKPVRFRVDLKGKEVVLVAVPQG